MADFCTQCSFMMWGYDTRDLAGLFMGRGNDLIKVICEGCGHIEVDVNGTCQTHTHAEHRKMWEPPDGQP
jgi:hypothetical protein